MRIPKESLPLLNLLNLQSYREKQKNATIMTFSDNYLNTHQRHQCCYIFFILR
jgi:hypothetical protein